MLIINKKTRLNIYSNSNSRIPLKSQNFSSLYNKLQICNSVMYGLRHPITLNKYTNINHLPNFSMLVFNKMFVGIIRLGPIISYRRYLQFSSVQFLLPTKGGGAFAEISCCAQPASSHTGAKQRTSNVAYT